jgi:hypothetical protein
VSALIVAVALVLSNGASKSETVTEMQFLYQEHAEHLSAECVDTMADEIEGNLYAKTRTEEKEQSKLTS